MKTIEERAREWCRINIGGAESIRVNDYGQRAYTAGATEQKAIMLEEASKGFKEWWKENYDKCGRYTTEEDALKLWQAATLSKMKEIEELKNNVSFAIKYMEAHNYQNYAPYEPENQMYASLKNALNAIK